MVWAGGLISSFSTWLPNFPSTKNWVNFSFPYFVFASVVMNVGLSVGSFLRFQFYSIDLYLYSHFNSDSNIKIVLFSLKNGSITTSILFFSELLWLFSILLVHSNFDSFIHSFLNLLTCFTCFVNQYVVCSWETFMYAWENVYLAFWYGVSFKPAWFSSSFKAVISSWFSVTDEGGCWWSLLLLWWCCCWFKILFIVPFLILMFLHLVLIC